MPNTLAFYFLAWLLTGIVLYRLMRSPLAKLPGPFHTTLTAAWLKYKEFSGSRRQYIHDLHQRHGPVVRLGPNEVSFASTEAAKEIYTSSGSGYDKTEFYNLFKQFNTRYDTNYLRGHPSNHNSHVLTYIRTLFSTLNKGDVTLFPERLEI
jgi:hypothetical protein